MPHLLLAAFFAAGVIASDAGPPQQPQNIDNFLRCSARISSGAQPTKLAHFQALAADGIATVVSVDGVAPDLQLAKQAGLRYVHIPFGYDGIPQTAALSVARVVRDTDGKIFIHCHHGRHRGPAAAAIACIIDGSADANRAKEILALAGTSKDYLGLWKDVSNFRAPPPNVALPCLHEVAPLKPLTTSMAELGREFEALKNAAQHEKLRHAVLIHENLKESFRSSKNEESAAYMKLTKQSLAAASEIRETLTAGHTEINHLVKALNKTCAACHEAHRN